LEEHFAGHIYSGEFPHAITGFVWNLIRFWFGVNHNVIMNSAIYGQEFGNRKARKDSLDFGPGAPENSFALLQLP